jgi:hypothetical protein
MIPSNLTPTNDRHSITHIVTHPVASGVHTSKVAGTPFTAPVTVSENSQATAPPLVGGRGCCPVALEFAPIPVSLIIGPGASSVTKLSTVGGFFGGRSASA